MSLIEIHREATRQLARLRFPSPVSHTYRPLEYARAPFESYLRRFGHQPCEILLLGMNPGPWGMAQTGVPFGEVSAVRDWLGIVEPVGKPRREHAKRPVLGFACPRREVSGARLWGWAKDSFGTPQRFFDRFFVANYCPLVFLEESGRNLTPDKIPNARNAIRIPNAGNARNAIRAPGASPGTTHRNTHARRPPATEEESINARQRLLAICDETLQATVEHLKPQWVIGVGKFAENQARKVLQDTKVKVGGILHPSPASPKANQGWAQQANAQLAAMGIRIP